MILTKFLFLLSALFLHPNSSQARGITSAEGGACVYVANNFTNFPFDCKGPDLAYKCRCKCPAFLGTVLLCIENNTNDTLKLTKAYNYILDVCENQALTKYQFGDLVRHSDNATQHVMQYREISNQTKLHSPVNITSELYDPSYKAVTTLIDQRQNATNYGWILIGYWVLILIGATMVNVAQWCFPYYFSEFCNLRLVKWFRRHFICPQIVRPSTTVIGKETNTNFFKFKSLFQALLRQLPIRIHALVISVYILLVILFCCINYKNIPINTIFRCSKGQTYVNIADRTGIIGTMQLPIVFLFSTRNNPLLVITGASYREFQMYHKWTSRVFFILITLHAIFYLLYVDAKGDYIARWGLLKWRWANTAFALLAITTFLAFSRARFYEFFKMTHKLMMVFFIVGIWYHCITLGWIEYIMAAFIIWGLEYVFRASKIIITGGVLRAKCSVLFETINKQIDDKENPEYEDIPHTIRIEINHSGWWKPFPGAFCWVYFLNKDLFWQAHPFTIVSPALEQNFNQLVLIIRVKKGMTEKLAELIASKPNAEASIPILVEGPYGSTIPFKAYDHSIFVAGGVGMTIVYTLAMDLAQTYRAQILRKQKEKDEKSLSIVWMAPNFESVFSFKKEIESIGAFDGLIELQIFITRSIVDPNLRSVCRKYAAIGEDNPNLNFVDISLKEQLESPGKPPSVTQCTSQSVANSNKTSALNSMVVLNGQTCPEGPVDNSPIANQKVEKAEFLENILKDKIPFVTLNITEKPNLRTELAAYIHNLNGSTAVIACGPKKMNADVRVATVECLKGNDNVDYFEEELLW